MKKRANRIEHTGRRWRILLAVLALVVLAALAAGVCLGYARLKALWVEPCALRDASAQVLVTTGKMVKEDVVLDAFGLRPGANLALVDFPKLRREALAKYPMIRDIRITRRLPDRAEIVVEEREPFVRLAVSGRAWDGRVADLEGHVFTCRRGTQALPILREGGPKPAKPGERLTGGSFAALLLLQAIHRREFLPLGVQEASAVHGDYILVILGDYSRAKVAWPHMGEDTVASREALGHQLGNLLDVFQSRLGPRVEVWNATVPGRVYADTKEIIP